MAISCRTNATAHSEQPDPARGGFGPSARSYFNIGLVAPSGMILFLFACLCAYSHLPAYVLILTCPLICLFLIACLFAFDISVVLVGCLSVGAGCLKVGCGGRCKRGRLRLRRRAGGWSFHPTGKGVCPLRRRRLVGVSALAVHPPGINSWKAAASGLRPEASLILD